jgi:hypothetical protein
VRIQIGERPNSSTNSRTKTPASALEIICCRCIGLKLGPLGVFPKISVPTDDVGALWVGIKMLRLRSTFWRSGLATKTFDASLHKCCTHVILSRMFYNVVTGSRDTADLKPTRTSLIVYNRSVELS